MSDWLLKRTLPLLHKTWCIRPSRCFKVCELFGILICRKIVVQANSCIPLLGLISVLDDLEKKKYPRAVMKDLVKTSKTYKHHVFLLVFAGVSVPWSTVDAQLLVTSVYVCMYTCACVHVCMGVHAYVCCASGIALPTQQCVQRLPSNQSLNHVQAIC